MVQITYLVCTIITAISACVYLIYNHKRVNFSFALIEILFVISNLGYYALSVSTGLSEAILANKITYIGSCTLPIVLFLTIAHICNFKINPIPETMLYLYSFFVFLMSLTPGYTGWYYKSVSLGKFYDATILIKEYGWAHLTFDVFLYGCLLMSVCLLIFMLFTKKNVSLKNVIILLAMEISSIFLYIISDLFAKQFEITAIIYVIDSIGMLIVSIRSISYNIEDSIINSLMEKRDYGYVIFNKDGIYLGCNSTAREFIPELNEMRIDKILPDEFIYKPVFIDWINAFVQNGDMKLLNIGESYFKCNIRYLYSNGKVNGYLMEIVDDTKQQEYIKLLDQVAKNKSNFLSNMSHEIRTPINAILGMNEMILKECHDNNIIEYAEDIDSSGRLLSALINDILDFSKIESGKMQLVPVSYNLKTVISNLVKMIHIRMEKKNLQFILEADPKTPASLYGDEIRIQQIVTNLLTNAVKYTDSGSVTLQVGYEPGATDDYCLIVFKVKDTGKGIKQEDCAKLFKAFERIDEEKNRNIEGTGLGLAITSRFVHMMNGIISVESEYGKGSTFIVKLPIAIIKAANGMYDVLGNYDDIFNVVRNKPGAQIKEYKAPDASILVVDDTEMNLKVVSRFLKNTGMKIVMVKSGAEAIEMVKNEKYDVILMDHMMPGMDGIECMQTMKREKLIGKTPVVALTANAVSDVDKQYISKGFNDYMLKPFKAAELHRLLLKYIPSTKVIWEE